MNSCLVSVKNLSAGYDGEDVISDISLNIYASDFIGIIGPNGGGKTTFLKTVLNIVKPSKGQILFPQGKLKIGYLPQASQLDKSFPITVLEVIESGLHCSGRWLHRITSKQKGKAAELLCQINMEAYAHKTIGELSGGQLQKVLLARAIINQPDLLVLDEPSTYVDKKFEQELNQWLKELNKKMAIILVSHDVTAIPSLVKSIACVNKTLHYHPSNELTRDLLKVYNCPIDLITHGELPHRVLKNHTS